MNEPAMVPCDRVIAKLWEYLDGELCGEDAARVREHLASCQRCAARHEAQRAYKEYLRRCGERPMPHALRRRVFEAILEEEDRRNETGGTLTGESAGIPRRGTYGRGPE